MLCRELLHLSECGQHPNIVQLKVRSALASMVALLYVPCARHVISRPISSWGDSALTAGLPCLQEVFLTPHHLGIAMEYVDGGDLAQWVQMHRIPDVSAGLLYSDSTNSSAHAVLHMTRRVANP